MPIIVKLPDDATVGEWAIVELQGDLESRDNSNIYEQFIGDLHYTNKGKPLLIIGHHILQGEVVTMDKPLAVLEHKDIAASENEDEKSVEYIVRAVVKKKLVFSDRPKPIIANVPKVI
ncbi:hypothetical protein L9F63_027319 [Diploptera punctata]|uniref:Chromosome transmission fidelity protein 8 n=1 Tax=Diploptera punctata TaxID=6984 RepID=A0AAD8AA77_DIPPU|nr:hypothetical protein L9F63_002293 [Diploptera punctata]KAJ9595294.1 hypothetical protein L9F63_027319 [Diploptera punctata]